MTNLPVDFASRGQGDRRTADRRPLVYSMKSRVLKIIITVECILLVFLFLVYFRTGQEAAPEGKTPVISNPTASDRVPKAEQTVQPSDEPVPPPTHSGTEQTPPLHVPEPSPVLPEQTDKATYTFDSPVPLAESVDDAWFSDAAFLGNSLVDGFRLFSGLTTCDVYAATSMTVLGADKLIEQMSAEQYGKVYILLGINEIGFDADYFKGIYADMLDAIREQQPDADIYIMSLTPVSEQKSTTDSTFSMDRIRLYNEKLLELAEEKSCYYIDLIEALADDTGYLPATATADGVHFAASHYQVWLEYLRTHHV